MTLIEEVETCSSLEAVGTEIKDAMTLIEEVVTCSILDVVVVVVAA